VNARFAARAADPLAPQHRFPRVAALGRALLLVGAAFAVVFFRIG